MTRPGRAARLCLLAALVLPALAVLPGIRNAFETPKSALWEPLALLAVALAVPGPWLPGGRLLRGAFVSAWMLWAAAVFAASFGAAPLSLAQGSPAPAAWLLRLGFGMAAVQAGLLAWAARVPERLGWIPRLAFALAACCCLSAACAGRPDAAVGVLLDWGGYLAVFAAAWSFSADRKVGREIVAAVLLAGAANAAFGLAQSAGVDPWGWSAPFGGRADAFFGNPNYLGGHLAVLLPLSLALALGAERAWFAAFAWGLFLVLGAGLIATQTRGAWAAAGVGCAAMLWAARRSPSGRPFPWAAASLGILALAGMLALWWFLAAAPQERARIAGTFNNDPEGGRRLFLMEKTVQLAARHPLLGVGPGSYRIEFPGVEAAGLDAGRAETRFFVLSEHGHNDFLQMAADAGWPAALLWACLFAAVFLRLVRGALSDPWSRWTAAAVLGSLAALAFHGLANFPFLVVPTQAAAWALAAVGLRSVDRPLSGRRAVLGPAPAARLQGGVGQDKVISEGAATRRAWAFGLLLAAAAILVQGRRIAVESLWARASAAQEAGRPPEAERLLARAVALEPREDRIWADLGSLQAGQGESAAAADSLRQALRWNRYDVRSALALGQVCLTLGQVHEARGVLQGVADYAPNLPDLWEPLAAADGSDGDFDGALACDDRMLALGIHENAALANKAAVLGNLGRYPEALDVLDQGVARFPSDPRLRMNLAITYYRMGRRADARRAWEQASRLAPADPQVRSLRKALAP